MTWHQELADTTLAVACIDVDADGELLIVDHRGGDEGGFYRFVPNQGDSVHDPAAFPRKLSETGLFQSVAGHRVQPSLIPYSVNAPLWSDGTYKERYMAIPGDSPKITMRATGGWDFPNGTVLVKSFALKQKPEIRRRDAGSKRGYSHAKTTSGSATPINGTTSRPKPRWSTSKDSTWILP